MLLKFSRTEILLCSLAHGFFASVFSVCLELDPLYYFLYGLAVGYLNMELQDRLWSWLGSTGLFTEFRFQVSLALNKLKRGR